MNGSPKKLDYGLQCVNHSLSWLQGSSWEPDVLKTGNQKW